MAGLPDLETLTLVISSMLIGDRVTEDRVTILDREPNFYLGTCPSEIVTCQIANGSELRLLCKYMAGHSHNSPLKMSVSVSALRQDNDRQTDRHIASQRRYQQHSQTTGG